MASGLSKIISTNKYNFFESRRSKAFEKIENSSFAGEYSFYRLRFFVLNLVINTFLNLILFTSYYKEKNFSLFFVHLALAVVLQMWWGATHVLIRNVKNDVYFGKKLLINQQFNSWLAGTMLGGLIFTISLFFIFSEMLPHVRTTILAFMLIRFLFKLVYRVFYSLVFVMNRVYTPFTYIVLTDLIFVLIIYLSSNYSGLPVSSLLFIISVVNFAFFSALALKQAKDLNLIDIGYVKKRFLNFSVKLSFKLNKDLILFALSALALGSNILLFFKAGKNELMQVFLMLPFILASQGWLRSFYFDLTDAKTLLNKKLRRNYMIYLIRSWPIAAVLICTFYAAFCVLAQIDIQPLFMVFMATNILFSIFLYEEFAKLNLGNLIFILFCEITLIFFSKDLTEAVLCITIFRLLGITYFSFKGTNSLNLLNGYDFILPLDIWSDTLSHQSNEINIYLLKFNSNIKKSSMNIICKKLAFMVGDAGKVCLTGRHLLIYSYRCFEKSEVIETAEGAISFYKELDKNALPDLQNLDELNG